MVGKTFGFAALISFVLAVLQLCGTINVGVWIILLPILVVAGIYVLTVYIALTAAYVIKTVGKDLLDEDSDGDINNLDIN